MSNTVNQSNRGFTIVELLIVIVVIAILAAISIVAYTGIQNNARASERQQDANNIVKVAETYFAQTSAYPTTIAHFAAADNAKLPANIDIATTEASPSTTLGTVAPTITSTNGPTVSGSTKTYIVRSCGATSGIMVYYFDPRDSSTKTVRAGTGGCV